MEPRVRFFQLFLFLSLYRGQSKSCLRVVFVTHINDGMQCSQGYCCRGIVAVLFLCGIKPLLFVFMVDTVVICAATLALYTVINELLLHHPFFFGFF